MRPATATLLALVLLAPAAYGGPRVPEVPPARLPVAGTCAPLPSANLTWVTVGQEGWYRIDGDARDVDAPELHRVLAERALAAGRTATPHDVWLVIAADREWGDIVNVLGTCQEVGLHRVGLQVRSEAEGGLFGFPLFLPYARAGEAPPVSTGSARRLDVRMEATGERPSYAPRLYAAAAAAVQKYAPVVAEVSISVRSRVQDAVTAIDLLYRAGCAGVRLRYRMVIRSRTAASIPEIWVEERLLPSDPSPVEVPPMRPRKAPWPDDGAGQSGALALVLQDIPSAGPGAAAREAEAARLQPLPSYAARGGEVPPAALAEAALALRQWSVALGGWLHRILTEKAVQVPETLLVKRRRQGLGVEQMFAEARAAFPAATQVVPATLRVQAYLFQGTKIVGKVDLTLDLAREPIDTVFASWVVEEFPQALGLPPVETEPFAAGLPGQLRVFVEGLLAALRARGTSGIPIAPLEALLAELPPVAHAGVRAAFERRAPALEALAGWLRATPYDRVLLAVVDGQAAVHAADGTIPGVLRFALEGESGVLALATLAARLAPR